MTSYSLETHGELHPFLNYEWLLTNGAGAFASSSVVACNARRYHGLLCATTLPPVGRIMTLNRVGELVHLDDSEVFHELSVNQFAQSFHPRGDKFLRTFTLSRTARWDFAVEGVKIRKELLLYWKRNAIGLRYTIDAPPGRPVMLRLLPFVSMRDFHSLRSTGGTRFDVKTDASTLTVAHAGHTLHLSTDAGHFEPHADWWFGHSYALETDRGLDDTEDLFVPAHLICKTKGPSTLTLTAALDDDIHDLPGFDEENIDRPEARPEKVYFPTSLGEERAIASQPATPAIHRLTRAANDFVVARRRPDGQPGVTVIAGYPWFADWGRDTMISLPGLLLATGRFEEARQVLTLFAEYVSEGMIPNRFDDYDNTPSYNTVDASLWFVNACFDYLRHSADRATLDLLLLPACKQIIDGYRRGTRFNIHMDPADSLIFSGDECTQLTWMDAKCQGVAFTPRHGKAVEINALWYNALMLTGEHDLAAKVKQNFLTAFWLNPFRGLADVVHGDHKDTAIRPNQVFAVSLPHSPLNHDQQAAVVEVVRRELLTPYGLRTLARSDPLYHGRFFGGPMQRDKAYHNGTVWPWPIGAFLEAYLRVHDRSTDAVRQARVWLQPLLDHMNQGCVGQIHECFEGDEPHKPVAAPAQAWSVAEVLRLAAMLNL